MAIRIRIEHGQDAGKTWRLGQAGTYRFGRNPASSVQVLDMKVSKDHFEIGFADDVDATIRDLESSHGTLLNGQPVTHAGKPLVPGDEIRVGLTVLRVLSDGPADGEAEAKGPPPVAVAAPAAVDRAAATTGSAPSSKGTEGPGDTTARRTAGGGSVGGVTPQTGGGPRAAGDTTARRQAPLPPDALVGQTLAGYKILEKVGAGGMGAVYRAEQLSLHREVALKVLAEKLVSDSAFVDQFLNEARAAGQLNHPNVVQVYDVGQADGRHFFSMEYIHGGSVESRIPRGGKGIPWTDALSWFLDAANALVFAERKGILHRDIKPDNFMISQDGSAKLCDLGLAKKSESDDLLSQGIIGTPHFISPEAIRRRTDVDKRSDLYSLGCAFYKVMTGKNPYPLGSVKEILLAHLNAPVPRVSALAPDVPKELDEIVFKLMQKEPKDRFQDAAELWTALDKVRLQHGMAAHGLNPGRAKKIAIFVTVAALVVVGIAAKIALAPPKTEIVYQPGTDTPRDDTANTQRLASQDRELEFINLEKDELKLSNDRAQEQAWEEMARKWEAFAKKHQGTDREEPAKHKAQTIHEMLARQRAADAKHAAEVATCCSLVDELTSKAKANAEALHKQGNLLEAERVLRDAHAAIEKQLLLKDEKLQPFYEAAKGKKILDELTALIDQLVGEVTKAWTPVKDAAEKLKDKGTIEELEKAKGLYETWLRDHPVPDATVLAQSPQVGGMLAAYGEEARKSIDTMNGSVADLRGKQLQEDNRTHFALVKEAHRPQTPEKRGGWYAEFDAGTAATAFQKAAEKARTAEFKALESRWAAEAQKLSGLVGRLAKGYAEKPWKDPIQGNGWKGPIQEIKAESVKVGNQERFFRNEGLAFFVELFFDAKGLERFPLTADEHEGLAILAEAAGIAFEGPTGDAAKLFERAQKEFERAASLDAGRAERLKGRLEESAKERDARALFLGAREDIDKADAQMDALVEKLQSGEKKVRDTAPKLVSEQEKDIAAQIQGARRKADELERNFPGTRTRAVLSDTARPPDGARYAGVDVPPEKPDPTPADVKPPTTPAGGGPGMGDGAPAGMGDGAGPGMDGPMPAGPAPGPGPGMDAPPPGSGNAPGPTPPKEPAPPGMDPSR